MDKTNPRNPTWWFNGDSMVILTSINSGYPHTHCGWKKRYNRDFMRVHQQKSGESVGFKYFYSSVDSDFLCDVEQINIMI